MPAVVGVAWTVFAIVAFALSLFSIAFTKYHQSKRESELSATIVTTVAITLILATVALLPIDVFLVSSTVDSHTGLKKNWADADTVYWMTFTVQVMYYIFYGSIVAICFFIIPYTYFYYEEYESQGQTKVERRRLALKYALFFITICALLFFFGLFLKPNILPPHIDLEWFKNLLTESNGAKACWFVVACLFLPGMAVFIVYTAPGLSILPFNLIKGKSKIDAEYDEIHHRLALVRERQQLIENKYSGSDEALNAHDYRTLENLNDEERILVRRLNGIEQDKTNFFQRFIKLFKPFKVLIGLILIICTILMMVSIFMTIVDKLSFSVCGRKCGYIISQTRLFNPVNLIFVQLQKLFPLDYVFMVGIVIYFLLATMMGIIQIGVRFLWVTLYRIKKGSTAPQGLLFSAILLTFGLLALNYSITSVVAPGYAHYGSQVYCNHTERGSRDCSVAVDMIVPCDIYAPLEICTPTVSSTLIDRITLNTPIFGFIFYYSQWAFLVTFTFGFLISLFKSPTYESREEEEGLLDGH
ncbi:putative lysosomal cobalamin transporter [Thamnidium elegans]|nr:putative lysosomal cobalamin transporter [Thamnidium elegans]